MLIKTPQVNKAKLEENSLIIFPLYTPLQFAKSGVFLSRFKNATKVISKSKIYSLVIGSGRQKRDVKGMYKKAKEGKVKDFTGISAPFEQPQHSDITVDTEREDLKICVKKILKSLKI